MYCYVFPVIVNSRARDEERADLDEPRAAIDVKSVLAAAYEGDGSVERTGTAACEHASVASCESPSGVVN
jgi:hypothetical protein